MGAVLKRGRYGTEPIVFHYKSLYVMVAIFLLCTYIALIQTLKNNNKTVLTAKIPLGGYCGVCYPTADLEDTG